MDIPDDAKRARAVLSKQDEPDIHLELVRISAADFYVIENHKNVGVHWHTLATPLDGKPGLPCAIKKVKIAEAFEDCLARRYSGYAAKQVEYLSE